MDERVFNAIMFLVKPEDLLDFQLEAREITLRRIDIEVTQ